MKQHYIFPFLIIVLFFSCNKSSVDPELLINVDDEFTLDLWESLESGVPDFSLQLETIKEYDCADNTIKHRIDARENIVVITLEQIDQKSDCVPGLAPASSAVSLNTLTPGNYGFRIKLKETIANEGNLLISDDKYQLTLDEDAVGIKLLRNELRRIPKGTIWGFAAAQSAGDQQYVDRFLADVEGLSTVSKRNLTEGYYGYFTVDANQQYVMNDEEVPNSNTTHFVYEYTGTVEDLKAMSEKIQQDSGGRAAVKLFWFL